MVDIHSHFLWGLDDGAESYEESLAMLRVAAGAGTTDIVATPHSNTHYYFDPEAIEDRIRRLQDSGQPMPRLHRGCDFHLNFANISEASENPGKFTINHGNYLLVEFPDVTIPVGLGRVFSQFLDSGIVPILTHPERNSALMRDVDQLVRWVDEGCLMQVTALSLLGGFGKSASEHAWNLLERRLVHVVASDAHDPERRHPRLDEARLEVARRAGEENAARLLVENPAAIIAGRGRGEIAPMSEPPRKRFRFWR